MIGIILMLITFFCDRGSYFRFHQKKMKRGLLIILRSLNWLLGCPSLQKNKMIQQFVWPIFKEGICHISRFVPEKRCTKSLFCHCQWQAHCIPYCKGSRIWSPIWSPIFQNNYDQRRDGQKSDREWIFEYCSIHCSVNQEDN